MTLLGKLIEYVDHGKFICAMVVEDGGSRLGLLNQNGREVKLPLARVVHCSAKAYPGHGSREELLNRLKETGARRQELELPVSLAEVWELASQESDVAFEPSFLAELCFGQEVDDDRVAIFLRAVFADRLFFKYREGKIMAHSPAVVEELQLRAAKEQEREELFTNGVFGLRQLWEGTGPKSWPEIHHCLGLIRDYYLHGSEAQDFEVARELLKRAELTKAHDGFDLLVKAGIWNRHENIPLLRQEVPVAFSAEVEEEASHLPELEPAGFAGRQDYRELPIFTIDGAATRDYDDALHLEKRGDNYLVGIHIADVAHYVKPKSALFQAALERGTSLYFPDGHVPMLPKRLSEGLCSLIAGKERLALSFMVLLTAEGQILEYEIRRSVIRVKRQLTYTGADAMLESDPELKVLANLSLKLRQRRIENGAMLLPIPDVVIRLMGEDQVEVRLADVDTGARVLVAEFMVLANRLGAEYLADREAPGLFRSQAAPRKRIIDGYDRDLFLNFMQRRQLARGQLQTVPAPHSGVGVMSYTTLTSPIRRLLDLIMQLQISQMVLGKGCLFSKAELDRYVVEIGELQTRANLVGQLRHRYWLLTYLEGKVGERVEAIILEKNPRRIQVLLLDILLEVDLPPNQGITIPVGEKVNVVVARVNARDNLLRLEW